MATTDVPVTLGSSRSSHVDVPGFHVARVRFPPLLRLPLHTHEYSTVAVILAGSFDGLMAGRAQDCPPGTAVLEPAGEPHGNAFDRAGAEVLIVQPDPDHLSTLEPIQGVLSQPHHLRDSSVALLARRAASELPLRDSAAPFAIEGLVLELLAASSRVIGTEDGSERRHPHWLAAANDYIQDGYLDRLRVRDVAVAVGVHPVHLARTFRTHYGHSVGEHLRSLRLDWAASRLSGSADRIADIALQAGFYDQSHFSRAFKSQYGLSPQRYRDATH